MSLFTGYKTGDSNPADALNATNFKVNEVDDLVVIGRLSAAGQAARLGADLVSYAGDPTGATFSNTALIALLNSGYRDVTIPRGTWSIGPWAPGDFEIPSGTTVHIAAGAQITLNPDTSRQRAISTAYYRAGVLVDDPSNTSKQTAAVSAMNAAAALMPDVAGITAAASSLAANPADVTNQATAKTVARTGVIYEQDRTHFLTARGSSVSVENPLPASIASTSKTFTATDGTKYTAGDLLLLFGTNTLTDTTDRFGYLRDVSSVTGTAVRLAAPVPRSITSVPRTVRVTPKKDVSVVGGGSIRFADPVNSKGAFVFFQFVENPLADGITVREGGGSGVWFDSCINIKTGDDFLAVNLLDDDIEGADGGGAWVSNPQNIPGISSNPNFVTHFGYGVNVTGACRGGEVRGEARFVRHSVTTNSGSPTAWGSIGEPESVEFWIRATFTSSNGMDTHRAGIGIKMYPTVLGAPTGVNVRSDETTIFDADIRMSDQYGITISSVVNPARACEIYNPRITGVRALHGIHTAGSGTVVRGGRIKDVGGRGLSTSDVADGVVFENVNVVDAVTGVNFQGTNGSAHNVTVTNATNPWVHGGTNNRRSYDVLAVANAAARPPASQYKVGGAVFDQQLNQPIYSTGTSWVKADGTSA